MKSHISAQMRAIALMAAAAMAAAFIAVTPSFAQAADSSADPVADALAASGSDYTCPGSTGLPSGFQIDPSMIAAELRAIPGDDGVSATAQVKITYAGINIPYVPVYFAVSGAAQLASAAGETGEAGTPVVACTDSTGVATVTISDNAPETITVAAASEGYSVPPTDGVQVTFTPPAPAATVITSADATEVAGTAQPNASVEVGFPDGSTETTTADAYGAWSTAWPSGLQLCGTVTATATLTASEGGATVAAEPHDAGSCVIPAPTYAGALTVPSEDATVGDTVSASATVTESDAPAADVPVTFTVTGQAVLAGPDGAAAGQSVTVNTGADGVAQVSVTDANAEDVQLSAALDDGTQLQNSPATIRFAAATVPTLPTVITSANADGVAGTAQPNASVTIGFPDGSTQTTSADANGAWQTAWPSTLTVCGTVTATATLAESDGGATVPAQPFDAGTCPAPTPTYTGVLSTLVDTAFVGTAVNAFATVTVDGAPAPGIQVVFTVDGQAMLQAQDGTQAMGQTLTMSTDASGVATVTVTDNVAETVTVSATDTNGNPLTGSPATVTFGSQSPISEPTVIVTAGSGGVVGTAAAGSSVAVTFPDGSVEYTTADDAGAWSVAWPSTLPVCGSVNAVATLNDVPQAADAYDAGTCQVSLTAPVVTTPVNGTTTSNTRPTFAGTGAVAGNQVSVVENGTVWCLATANSAGAWSCTPSSAMGAGAHTVLVAQTDAAGNLSPSTTVTFTVGSSTNCCVWHPVYKPVTVWYPSPLRIFWMPVRIGFGLFLYGMRVFFI